MTSVPKSSTPSSSYHMSSSPSPFSAHPPVPYPAPLPTSIPSPLHSHDPHPGRVTLILPRRCRSLSLLPLPNLAPADALPPCPIFLSPTPSVLFPPTSDLALTARHPHRSVSPTCRSLPGLVRSPHRPFPAYSMVPIPAHLYTFPSHRDLFSAVRTSRNASFTALHPHLFCATALSASSLISDSSPDLFLSCSPRIPQEKTFDTLQTLQ